MKKYTLEVIEDNKFFKFKSTNDGFSSVTILGILEAKKTDILKQMAGTIKPDIIERTLIVDKSECTNPKLYTINRFSNNVELKFKTLMRG